MPFAHYLTFHRAARYRRARISSFATLNERELRRRRYDAEVLRSLAVGLETTGDSVRIATALARLAVDDLLATWALIPILQGSTM
ncbi:hypothetical protein AB0J80_11815 [Actinoplanes sp. NPDC049548]|uniref:hypothetical protein n=1 Tax=Actinoplanes sp. NPDC049548 TaxID=3155152 RepID=UPI003413A740